MPAPERFASHLRERGYHPRSNLHSNTLSELVLDDLLATCQRLREHAAAGKLVYSLNFKIMIGGNEWNIDLVLGPPPAGLAQEVPARGIQQARPATIRIAVEAKAIMTEHGKARRNRQRDLDSFHQYVHRYDTDTVAATLTVVNIAARFKSPLRPDMSVHRNVKQLVQDTLALLRLLPGRSAPGDPAGLEANGAFVVDYENVEPRDSRLLTAAPAPQVGDPLHYDTFRQRICDRYVQRWP